MGLVPRSKLQRDQERDISELIALGQPNPRISSEAQYDQRLFNQSRVKESLLMGDLYTVLQCKVETVQVYNRVCVCFQGMDSGFAGGEDEVYNVYDQPFGRGRDMAQNIYRPSKNTSKDMYGDDLDTLMQNNR